MSNEMKISSWSHKLLEEQGYRGYTNGEISLHRFGIRFAYVICLTVVVLGLIFKSQTLLLIAGGIAFLGMFPPYHPIDYLYNYGVRHMLNRPKLPPRANQGRFACAIATTMLAFMNYYLYMENLTVVYILGAFLISSAFKVSFFDFCVPSKIYNAIFKQKSGLSENSTG